jgi:hypothetical protein
MIWLFILGSKVLNSNICVMDMILKPVAVESLCVVLTCKGITYHDIPNLKNGHINYLYANNYINSR